MAQLFSLGVIAFMTQEQPASVQRDKPPRYLTLAEWFCYLYICLVPLSAMQFMPPEASGFEIGLLTLALVLLGVVGLGVVMGRKHRYRKL